MFRGNSFFQDVHYAARSLRKNKGFAIVAILTLALGIGANTAIFTVVNAVLLRPLPFRDPTSLCLLTERHPNLPQLNPSYQNWLDWKGQAQSFSGVAGVHITPMTLTGSGEPERLQGQMATANLFPLLGISAVRGHTFLPEEDKAAAPRVVLLSYGFWKSHFGGTESALGRTITLDNQTYTVTGVLPPQYQLIQPADVVIPFEPWTKKLPDDRSWHPGIVAIARLRPGVSLESAQAEMTIIAKRLERQYPVYDTDVAANVTRLHEQIVQNVRPALLVLLGAVGLVLLIACTNVAGLSLARSNERKREMAVRTAIGAGRLRIARQLLTESVLLSVAGGIAGVAIALAGVPVLVRLASNSVPNLGPIEVDRGVLLFAAAVVLTAGILFGLVPAIQSTRTDLRTALNDASRGSTAGSATRQMRKLLVVAEIALALILLVGAGLLLRSFEQLQTIDPGFSATNLLVADLPVSPQAYPKSPERMQFCDRILERAAVLPGVVSVGAATNLPVSGGGSLIHFNIEGRAPKSGHDYIAVGYRPVSPKYLQTLRVPLLQGRLLNDSDTDRTAFVVVVNQVMQQRFFPGQSVLGKHVQLGALPNHEVPQMEIVGVVGNLKQNLANDADAEMYLPYRQADTMLPVFGLSIVLRTVNDPRTEISALRSVVRGLDPNQPLVKIRTMEENISTNVSEPRFRTVLLCIFAVCALLLAVIGLYGLMMYSTVQRIPEFGIRITLGATSKEILTMVLTQGLRLALYGVVLGMALAFALSRVLTKFLFHVTPGDPLTYVAVAVLLIVVALAACWIPARRAMKIDPMTALRYE